MIGYDYPRIEEMFGPYEHVRFGGAMTDDRAFELYRRRAMLQHQTMMQQLHEQRQRRKERPSIARLAGWWA